MPVCGFCGENVPFVNKCLKCESEFCEVHTVPSLHDCPGVPVPNPYTIPAETTPAHEIGGPVGEAPVPLGQPSIVTKAIVREWLGKMGVEHIFDAPREKIEQATSPEDRRFLENVLLIPYKLDSNDAQGQPVPLMFEVKILILEKWVNVKLLLMRHEEVPPNVRPALHEVMLVANFMLNEVTYSVSRQGDIIVETDMPINTDQVNFQCEYGSIEFGTLYFLKEILPKISSLKAVDTYLPRLYI